MREREAVQIRELSNKTSSLRSVITVTDVVSCQYLPLHRSKLSTHHGQIHAMLLTNLPGSYFSATGVVIVLGKGLRKSLYY